jgi:phospholipase/lecithinase/hemolysin
MAWSDFLADDRLHPNDKGHRLMADMVIYTLQQAAVDVLLHPVTPAEAAASKAPLRPPMFAGARAARPRDWRRRV